MSDYVELAAKEDAGLRLLEGRILIRVLVDVVTDQFNVLWLMFEDATFAVQGLIGGELLHVVPVDEPPTEGPRSEFSGIRPYPPFAVFEGRRLIQARSIGAAWHGHGFEFSFEGLPDAALLVQSIYAGARCEEYHDCLRLGVGHYEWRADPPAGAET